MEDSEQRGGWKPWMSFVAVVIAAIAIGIWHFRAGGSGGGIDGSNPTTNPQTAAESEVASTTPTESSASQASPTLGRLDPEPYRGGIESLESILRESSSSDIAAADRAALEAHKLSVRIQGSRSSLFHRQAARAILKFSSQLAGQLGSGHDSGAATFDISFARRHWQTIRDSHFEPAGWFHQFGARRSDAGSAAPPIDTAVVDRLHQVAAEIEVLISEGRPVAEGFGEPFVDAPARSRQLDVLVREWKNWASKWSARVHRVGNGLPKQPASDSDVRLLKAYDNLNSALQQLAAIPNPANESGVPFRSARRTRFDRASLLSKESQELLSVLQQ
jgi:hypothetical protein